mmetsp:Transcript_11709/g.20742  ORF Transcript_11709/g.20742 Transcript_11709/m.20742 type:complete len:849 (+) Transcript_11709:47-2593(+)|eukprot:CAMPEP_0197629256 /NCGR_PEP_ID=MMETSP1338-20131121/7188_1 /TAXON_ID=43686 ORGANISM="Pelagodinium beii, Strain RCC1491" /NCGR_SAMPLE_ID=MMETSP1338 /ASSEMBLY_ACC=CAM_ASM_000754 /LENGTH=848 /DNA_ID=CAMNT_0043200283 /DNA_START=47 /DNA_END=2593 /DNA_ORIENTATION=+
MDDVFVVVQPASSSALHLRAQVLPHSARHQHPPRGHDASAVRLGTGLVSTTVVLAALRSRQRRARVLRRAEGRSTVMSGLSQQMRAQRKQLEESEDEELKLMMQGLRGSGINDSDQQVEGLEMRLVDIPTDEDTGLPLTYDPEELKNYFDRLPGVQLQRIFQIMSTGGPLIAGVIWDRITGRNDVSAQVERAAQFNEIVTTLGPFFIKLGQALSIRPDLLSPRAMVELQKLCDKVPSYSSEIAMATLEKEYTNKFAKPTTKMDIFSSITPEPVAAASLGQVYKATLREPAGTEVAVKVQRPAVLETVSLDLYLIRKAAQFIKYLQEIGARDARRTDFVALLDEFAARIYEEMDYNKECTNGLQVEKDMAGLERVKIPKNYEQYCARKVHVAEWVEGEKLSQSQAGDIRELVNVGVVAYLTQLLDKGLFHADPHPGNMLRTPDGRLAILDFGLMTKITDDQRYGMVEAIAHLVHRDYAEIGTDFRNLDFIPAGVDVKPIVPALSRVFDSALAGGGAKGINFNELSADLAQITFEFPFRIPPYFALIIRAIGVLEGIALVGDPDFAIIDEAYPYLSKQLLTDPSDRLRAAFRYMVYGKEGNFDADRLIDLLRALEAFRLTEKAPDAEEIAAKAAASQASGGAGLVQDTERTETGLRREQMKERRVGDRPTSWAAATEASSSDGAREALTFLLSADGAFFREFLVEETVKGVDCLGRSGLQALGKQLAAISPLRLLPGVGPAISASPLGPFGDLFAPPLTPEEEKIVTNTTKLLAFLLGDADIATSQGLSAETARSLASTVQLFRDDPELARGARELAQKLSRRAFELVSARALRRLASNITSDDRSLVPA